MHVCIITNQIAAFGKIGGFGSMARMLGRELAASGVEVTVVCRRRGGQGRVTELDGMRVVGLPSAELMMSSRVFSEIDADIYHSYEPTIGTWLAQRGAPGAAHVVTCIDPRNAEDWRIEFRYSRWRRKLVYPFQRYYEDGPFVRRAVRRADAVTCQAKFIIPKVVIKYGLDGDPIFMPNLIDAPEDAPDKSPDPTCCFVGRFDPRKRPELFFQLAERNPDLNFVAVGRAHDSSYDSYLSNRYGRLSNLDWLGFVDPFSDLALSQVYGRSWILVNTSAREGLPATFLEALGHGCALLAGVDPDGVTTRYGAFVVDDFQSGLDRLLGGNLWRDLGVAGRAFVQSTFAVPQALVQHMAIYERLLSSHDDRRKE